MEISYSALSFFKSCRAKYRFKNIMKLKPKHDTPTSVGRTVHEAFEKYFNGESKDECALFISNTFDNALGECKDPWMEEDLIVGKYTARGMWDYYPFDDLKFDEVKPEVKFSVSIPGLRGIKLMGYVDGLVREGGRPWVREVKTTGLSIQQLKSRSDVSYQGTGYVWAIQRALKEKIHGLHFDVIRKPLLRKNQKETATSFGERIYSYYVEPSNKDKLYGQFYSYRSEAVLEEFEKDLRADARDLRDARRKGHLQRNPDACYNYGRECPYRKICWQQDLDLDMLRQLYDVDEGRK